MTIGESIRDKRLRMGITQKALAEKMYVSGKNTVGAMGTGRGNAYDLQPVRSGRYIRRNARRVGGAQGGKAKSCRE